ncbi:MAG: hypothetical protein HYX48_01600 [Chlamydiales bacterium]|nr:hypothetical protein [Chlamydiales bacterium]
MNRFLRMGAVVICLLSSSSSLFAVSSQKSQDVEDQMYETNTIWIGPGWYGGYWFGNEAEFNQWHGNYNRHGYRGDGRGDHRGNVNRGHRSGGHGGGHGGGGRR